jgi:hypothetical protein
MYEWLIILRMYQIQIGHTHTVCVCPESNLVIHIEINEHEHKYSNGNYKCDEHRMSELAEETKDKLVVFHIYQV